MSFISEKTIEQVRSSADIIEIISHYIQLKKKGRNFFGLCPFHGEQTPSFSVNPERQIFKCFGCGIGGNVINFIMEYEKIAFIDAIKQLADQNGIEIELKGNEKYSKNIINELLELHNDVSKIYLENLYTDEGSEVLKYLRNRGINNEIINSFGLGFSFLKKDALLNIIRGKKYSSKCLKESGLFLDTEKGHIDRFRKRIIFPISNNMGKVIAFAGRSFNQDNVAKYMNSPETPIYNKSKILYGLHISKEYIRNKQSLIVVEGYLDFLQLFQSGIRNIVAVSGTALTNGHALQLKRFCKKIYLAYDGDKAGIAASIRGGYVLLNNGLDPQIVKVPKDTDPDDWVKTEGPEPFQNSMKNAVNLLEFHYNNFTENIETVVGKTNFINDVLSKISQLKDPILRELNIKSISELTKISQDSIISSLNNLINKKNINNTIENEEKSMILDESILLEEEIIQLCFSKEVNIRQFLFKYLDPIWLKTESLKNIYEKIYIHLNSTQLPESGLILNELKLENDRFKLTDLLYELEKMNPTLIMAKECVIRLKDRWLSEKLDETREVLKSCYLDKNKTNELLNKIQLLQKEKQELKSFF